MFYFKIGVRFLANLIKIDDNDFLVKDYLRQEEINENTLLLNYKTLLKRYLSQGEPSEDTLRSYCSAIDSYIKWCLTNKVHPLKITEYQFMYYRDFLIKMNMKKGSIKVKLNAIKQFYNIAVKLKLIENSPAKDVGVKIHEASEISPMKFLTLEQLRDLLNIIPDYDEKHIEYLRDKIIIMLMALEGLRTVEVHRMSVNDINWEMKTIYIHGKGHNDFIYPRDDVLILLQAYLKIRPFDFAFSSGMSTQKVLKVLLYREMQFLEHEVELLLEDDAKAVKNLCKRAENICYLLMVSTVIFDPILRERLLNAFFPFRCNDRVLLLKFVQHKAYATLLLDMRFFLREQSGFYLLKKSEMPLLFFVKKYLKKEEFRIAKRLKKALYSPTRGPC